MLYVALGILGVVALLLGFVMKREHRIAIAAMLAFIQVAIPLAPVFLVWVLYIGLLDMMESRPKKATWAQALLVSAALVSFIAMLWSVDPNAAAQSAIRYVALAMFIGVVMNGPNPWMSIKKAIGYLAPYAVIQSVATFVFLISPAVEEEWLRSSIARIFIGGYVLDVLYTTGSNNVLDPAKSGGLMFVNANVNSMWLGVTAFALFFGFTITRKKWLRFAGLISYAGVFATGSKTGLALGIAMPILWLLVASIRVPLVRGFLLPAALVGAAISAFIPDILAQVAPAYVSASETTMSTRLLLWTIAGQGFLIRPILGYGYGGWVTDLETYWHMMYPPHNLFIAAWADGGIVLAAIIIAIAVGLVIMHLRQAYAAPDRHAATAIGAGMVGVVWAMMHGMADNTTIYGDIHSFYPFAVLVAAAIVRRRGTLVDPGKPAHRTRVKTFSYASQRGGVPLALHHD